MSYISAVGDDPLSDWLIDEWQKEGVDCSMVERANQSTSGMYMVSVNAEGERSFHYWRTNSPASNFFCDDERVNRLTASLLNYQFVYLSGISLAILPDGSREKLMSVLKDYKASGGKVIFDSNYRPALWESEACAKDAYHAIYRLADIALPTIEDEMALFKYESAAAVIDAIQSLGAAEIVLKMGEQGCLAVTPEGQAFVPTEYTKPVDTTAAGDSFNAGYLAARFQKSQAISLSCEAGHQLASKVIQFPGAIIPLNS